jgi:capsule polysaccharide export protein KpsE/RkpR
MSQLSGGFLLSQGASTGELLIGALRTRTVVDKIIDQFDLMTLYGEKYRAKMRKRVTSDILHATEDTRSGIVTVAVLDEDPERAARMANAFVDELKNVMQSLALGEAAQRRLFFEQQMVQARETLDNAEDELSKYQEKSGLVAMDPQVEAMISSIATLRAQVAAKEVEISSLRTYARKNHPQLKRAETEFSALQGELEKLEREQKPLDGTTQIASLREAPQLSMEYQRRVRDVKYATTMYDLIFKQFEAAKLDESREAMNVQILDPAVPPDYKFKPSRFSIVVFATLLGLCLGMLWALLMEYIDAIKNDPDQERALKEIRAIFSFSKRQC